MLAERKKQTYFECKTVIDSVKLITQNVMQKKKLTDGLRRQVNETERGSRKSKTKNTLMIFLLILIKEERNLLNEGSVCYQCRRQGLEEDYRCRDYHAQGNHERHQAKSQDPSLI